MNALSDFGLLVKSELLKRGMTQSELEESVRQDTGLYVDSSYLYKILRGKRTPEKIVASIKKILDLEEKGDCNE